MDSPETALSLFSGIGGLDLGLKRAIPGLRTVGYVERDSYAAAVLVARMEDEALDSAPVWVGDIADFDAAPFLGVDLVHGGFPCQDLSVAGKQAGIDGERSGLWAEFARIIGDIRPRFVFIENVSGLLGNGAMRRVLGDLSALGFDAAWTSIRASDVGAPHRRERVFMLAHAWRERLQGQQPARPATPATGRGGGTDVGNAERRHDDGSGESGQRRRRQYPDSSSGLPPFPPGPGDTEAWAYILKRYPELAPAVAHAKNGQTRDTGRRAGPRGATEGNETEPVVCRVADGVPYRMERLRCLGNAVVPAQAAAAWRELWMINSGQAAMPPQSQPSQNPSMSVSCNR